MIRHILIFSLLVAAAGCTTGQPLVARGGTVGTAPRPAPTQRAPAAGAPQARAPQAEPARTAPMPVRNAGFPASTVEVRRPAPALPAEPPARVAPASAALLEQSRDQRAAGSYAAAASSIERALRIEPYNAELWLELGEIKLADGDAQQAEQMARKALTLAGADAAFAARAERLLALAASCALGGC